MTDDELLDLESAERRRLIEKFRETGEERFLHAAAELRGKAFDRASLHKWMSEPKAEGRPRYKEDRDLVIVMTELIQVGTVKTVQAAAKRVAGSAPGSSTESTVRRLATAYRKLTHEQIQTHLACIKFKKDLVDPPGRKAFEGPATLLASVRAEERRWSDLRRRLVGDPGAGKAAGASAESQLHGRHEEGENSGS